MYAVHRPVGDGVVLDKGEECKTADEYQAQQIVWDWGFMVLHHILIGEDVRKAPISQSN